MVSLLFIEADGREKTIETATGTSIMRAAVEHGVDGILAECGGNAQCATCHVYIDPSQLALLQPMRSAEDDMLDATAEPRQPNSRLSCQVVISREMNGLIVRLPANQI